jgi:hypothetical protein
VCIWENGDLQRNIQLTDQPHFFTLKMACAAQRGIPIKMRASPQSHHPRGSLSSSPPQSFESRARFIECAAGRGWRGSLGWGPRDEEYDEEPVEPWWGPTLPERLREEATPLPKRPPTGTCVALPTTLFFLPHASSNSGPRTPPRSFERDRGRRAGRESLLHGVLYMRALYRTQHSRVRVWGRRAWTEMSAFTRPRGKIDSAGWWVRVAL